MFTILPCTSYMLSMKQLLLLMTGSAGGGWTWGKSVKQRNVENKRWCIDELTTASEETPGCWVTRHSQRPCGALCLGSGGRRGVKREQFVLNSFHLLSFSDQSSPNSVSLLVCVIQPFWAAPVETGTFIGLVGLDLDSGSAECWLSPRRES